MPPLQTLFPYDHTSVDEANHSTDDLFRVNMLSDSGPTILNLVYIYKTSAQKRPFLQNQLSLKLREPKVG